MPWGEIVCMMNTLWDLILLNHAMKLTEPGVIFTRNVPKPDVTTSRNRKK
jgi:hypothetical protein